ncbi:MAG: VCBS repeat-containing protein [Planctomycetes bacterium]|nr:VCBS repeat-containing protein [Planctomycetota bacterium]
MHARIGARLEVQALGDVNADGVDDVWCSEPGHGRARILSGVDGATLAAPSGGDGFGWSAAVLSDRNGDGAAELLVGDPLAREVRILSGVDASTLWSAAGPAFGGFFGLRVASSAGRASAGGELFVVTSPSRCGLQTPLALNSVRIYALGEVGAQARRVAELMAPGADFGAGGAAFLRRGAELGLAVASTEHVDLYTVAPGGVRAAHVAVHRDEKLYMSIETLAPLGDLDGDGFEELGVGVPADFRRPVLVLSGRDLTLLWAWDLNVEPIFDAGRRVDQQSAQLGQHISRVPSDLCELPTVLVAGSGFPRYEHADGVLGALGAVAAGEQPSLTVLRRPALFALEFAPGPTVSLRELPAPTPGSFWGSAAAPLRVRDGQGWELLSFEHPSAAPAAKLERRPAVLDPATGARVR